MTPESRVRVLSKKNKLREENNEDQKRKKRNNQIETERMGNWIVQKKKEIKNLIILKGVAEIG